MATDNFTGTNGDPINASNWVLIGSSVFSINANACYSAWSGEPGLARYTGAFADDQYAQMVSAASGSRRMGPAVRIAASAATGYMFIGNNDTSLLMRCVAGVITQLGSSGPAFSVGNTIRLEVTGNILRPMINGSTWANGTFDDTADIIASGSPGIGSRDGSAYTRMDDWDGDALGGGAAGHPALRRFGGIRHTPRRTPRGVKVW